MGKKKQSLWSVLATLIFATILSLVGVGAIGIVPTPFMLGMLLMLDGVVLAAWTLFG